MVKRALQGVVLVALAACDLDPGIIYRCNVDGGCSRAGYACDGTFCVPADMLDGGARDAGPADAGAADAGGVDAGLTDAGLTDAGLADAGVDAGPVDAGLDAGSDAGALDAGALDAGGLDAGPLVCGGSCTVQCGYVDAGAGCAPLNCGYCAAGEQCGTELANTCSPTRLCNADGWCWENPLPQGNSLRGAWSRSLREQFLVGESLTVLRFDGEKLQLLPPPPSLSRAQTLYGVGGNATTTYVAGTNGAIARWDGAAWQGIAGAASVTLRAIAHTNDAIIVGSGYAYRIPSGTSNLLTIQLPTSANLVGVTVTSDGAVWALEDDGTLWKLDTVSATHRFLQQPAVLPAGVLGRDLVAFGLELVTLSAEVLPDAGEAARVDFLTPGASSTTQRLPEGLEMNALDVEPDGGVLVVGDDGEVRRVSRAGMVSTNLFELADVGASLRAVAFREPGGAVIVGTDGHFTVCTPPCTSPSDVVRKSGGTVRELFQMCGSSLDQLLIAGDRSCSGALCTNRVLGWGPSPTSRWQSFDVSDRPATEGRLHRCVESLGGAQQVVTTTGQVFPRTGNGFAQLPSVELATNGETITDLYSDENDDWFVVTSANRVRRFPLGGNAGAQSSGTVGTTLRTLYGVRSRRLTIGDLGQTWFIDTGPLVLTGASRGDNNTQRDFHGRSLPDGGELLVSAGDRGSLWHRVQGTDFSGGALDGGLTNDFLSVWVTPQGRIVAGTTTGQVAFGAPGVPFVTTTTPFVGPLNDAWGVTVSDGGVQVWVVGGRGSVLTSPAR